jgi:two-component system, OmpR family, phosphate regulon sensor histidine kinase PhoR
VKSRETWIIAAAALVMTGLLAAAGLSVVGALVGLAVLAAVVLATGRFGEGGGRNRPGRPDLSAGSAGWTAHMLAEIIETLPDPFLVLDGGSEILLANAPARNVFDKVDAGRHVSTVIRAPMVLDAIGHVAQGGGRAEVDYEQRVPIERRFEVHIASIATAGDHQPGAGEPAIAVLLRDLTQQQRVERMRADFVANASHELRTPLASVLGFIETLQGAARNDAEAREEFLELMRTQAARMARLIDDLLSLNRIELNAHLRPNDQVDVGHVVGHVADVMGPLARECGVEIVVTSPEGRLDARGDRDELVQVFQNLVENAVKYGASGKRVELQCERRDDGGIRVTVRDYGPGIAPQHVPRLTERFYRIDVTDSRQKGGTGLGLAIVKHILNRHRAKLTVRSRLGEGASFIVDLPVTTIGDQ